VDNYGDDKMEEKMIFAGFGGQGVMSMGQLLAYAGMMEGKNVLWLPSYGPEMRGGTANCHITISDEPISSPIITEATIVVAMNRPSLEKFENNLIPGGKLFINSSIAGEKPQRTDIEVYEIPANDIANELGNLKVANMVILGALIDRTNLIKRESLLEALKKVLGSTKEHLISINEQALTRGADIVKKQPL